jgi:hypothetical protein
MKGMACHVDARHTRQSPSSKRRSADVWVAEDVVVFTAEITPRTGVGLDAAVLGLVEDAADPRDGLVLEAPRLRHRHGRDRAVRHRVDLEDVAVLLAGRAAIDDLLARDPLLERQLSARALVSVPPRMLKLSSSV